MRGKMVSYDSVVEMVSELNRIHGLGFGEDVIFGMLKVLRELGFMVAWNSVTGSYELWV